MYIINQEGGQRKSHKSQTHIKVKSSSNNSNQECCIKRETTYFEFEVLDGVQ